MKNFMYDFWCFAVGLVCIYAWVMFIVSLAEWVAR